MRNSASCFIVMGPYRSGTSLVAQMLSELGVDFGPREAFQTAPDRYNPGGYFQRSDVVKANRRLIESAGTSLATPVEPEDLLELGSVSVLKEIDFRWSRAPLKWGMKDPRFCATLLAWLRSGILPDQDVKIVRVRRRLESIARSSALHREVGSFCGYDYSSAVKMANLYDQYAEWHCTHMGFPVIEVNYDQLMKQPEQAVAQLAAFVDEHSLERVERCLARIGKRRALLRHYAAKLTNPQLAFGTLKNTLLHWIRS